jgi:hypothetical protein
MDYQDKPSQKVVVSGGYNFLVTEGEIEHPIRPAWGDRKVNPNLGTEEQRHKHKLTHQELSERWERIFGQK